MSEESKPPSMSIKKAFSIIDRHVPPKPSITYGKVSPSKRSYRNGRDFPPNPTLPAFYVQWRDGPSPYDSHRGDYTESAAALWENTVNFDLAGNGRKVPREQMGPWKGHALLDVVREGDVEITVKSNYFRSEVMPEEVHLNDVGTARNTKELYNPARDRQQVERDIEADRTATFFRHLRRGKASLYKSCLRNYPHGALGLEESPYGDPGDIYGDQQRRLQEARRRAEHTMRGQAEVPLDHMHGSHQMRGEQFVRGRVYNAPQDNLFASKIVLEPTPEGQAAPTDSAAGERYIRFRSQNVPKDHLMGGALLDPK